MKRKTIISLLVIAAVACLNGCGTEVTDDERAIIAEYAANVLLRYDVAYNAKYITEEEDVEAQQEPDNTVDEIQEPAPTQKEEPIEVPAQTESIVYEEPTVVPQKPAEELKMASSELASLFGLSGVEMTYTGFEAMDSYPQTGTDELIFKLDAAAGKKLVVFKFELANVSGETKTCNIVGQNLKFKMLFNGSDSISVLKTLLLDDLSLLNVILDPNEKTQAVLICQVDAGYESSISTVDMTVRIAGENCTINLK